MNAIIEIIFLNGHLKLIVTTPRLDAAIAPEFKRACEFQWPAQVEILTVDMQKVNFIDSSGIGALLSLYKRLPASHGPLPLLKTSRSVRTVIELLRLQKVFALD